jgi:hypothetical protein
VTVARNAAAQHLAGGRLQRGEQVGHAMAHVVVGAPLHKPWPQRQRWRGTVQRLDLGFSSTHSTTAPAGGSRYSPHRSSTLACSCGSVENLKVSVRQGLRSCSAPGPRRSCVVSVSSEGDPESPPVAVRRDMLAGEQLPTRPCRRRDRPGVHRLVAERQTWAPGRLWRIGAASRLAGERVQRSSAAVGPVVWSAVASDRSAVGASSAGLGARESWAGVGGAGRSPPVTALVGARGRAAAARGSGPLARGLFTMPRGYRAAR